MKTHTITRALALLALGYAAGASAQSSVAVFGTIDANVGRYKGAAGGVTVNDKATARQDASGLTTSFFGLRGTEDLGGGLKASFDLQSFMRNDTGSPGRSDGVPNVVTADPFWSKSAWVGLGSASLGRVRLGNISTPLFVNSITSNAFAESTVFSPINLVTLIGSPMSGGTAWANTLSYETPNLSGFTGMVNHAFSEGGNGGNTGVRAAYANGPLAGSFAWIHVKKDPITFSDGTSRNNTKTWQMALSYDFTAVKVFGHLGAIKSDGSATATTADDGITHKIWGLSASMPLGQGKLLAGVAHRKGDELVSASKRQVVSIGYDYELSKRTDVYAVLRDDKTRAARTTVEANGTSYAVGMRHRF